MVASGLKAPKRTRLVPTQLQNATSQKQQNRRQRALSSANFKNTLRLLVRFPKNGTVLELKGSFSGWGLPTQVRNPKELGKSSNQWLGKNSRVGEVDLARMESTRCSSQMGKPQNLKISKFHQIGATQKKIF